jgi:transmembrane sensor
MEKDKLISFIITNQSFNDHPEVMEWINETEENKEEYIRYKNLWAIMQHGNDLSEVKIRDGLLRIRKNREHVQPFRFGNLIKYAALIVLALLGGYLIGTNDFNDETTMNEIFVPNGNRSSIVLPEGTKVWLNNGTKLIYPEDFKGKYRTVELDGEGFFDVTPDEKHPFIVKIGENRIKVLGTRFAVVAYAEDKTVKAELVSGKIQFDIHTGNGTANFRSYMMNPAQSLIFDKTSGEFSESKISDNFFNYWLKGIYEFKDETFENLAKRIERIYNVQVIFKDESLKNRLFTGSLGINDNIYTMMEVFKKASGEPFVYTHEGNHIFIEGKRRAMRD